MESTSAKTEKIGKTLGKRKKKRKKPLPDAKGKELRTGRVGS